MEHGLQSSSDEEPVSFDSQLYTPETMNSPSLQDEEIKEYSELSTGDSPDRTIRQPIRLTSYIHMRRQPTCLRLPPVQSTQVNHQSHLSGRNAGLPDWERTWMVPRSFVLSLNLAERRYFFVDCMPLRTSETISTCQTEPNSFLISSGSTVTDWSRKEMARSSLFPAH